MKTLKEQSKNKKIQLPMFWDKIHEEQKDYLTPFPDLNKMTTKQMRMAINRLVKNSNHFQSMVYANEINKPEIIVKLESKIENLRIEIHELRYMYEEHYKKECDALPL